MEGLESLWVIRLKTEGPFNGPQVELDEFDGEESVTFNP